MTEGRKDDTGKPRWDLMPWAELEDVVRVLTHGAEKYGPDNWKRVDNAKERYTAAAFRHMVAYAKGESDDPESGLSHLAHAVCNLLFLSWFEKSGEILEIIDEPMKPVLSEKRCMDCKWCGDTGLGCKEPEFQAKGGLTCDSTRNKWEPRNV